MNIRYVLSHINKDGMRVMTSAIQGRHTFGSTVEAEQHLQGFNANNTPENLTQIFGSQALGTFEVSAIECYEGHNDPKGGVIKEALNPGQVCLTGPLKKIFENLSARNEEAL
jgi:hypothetical protein